MLRDIMKPNFRSGNLKKLGRVRKNWLERFFTLISNMVPWKLYNRWCKIKRLFRYYWM